MAEESSVSVTVPAEIQKLGQALVDGLAAWKSGKSWQEVGMGVLPVVLGEFGSLDELKAEVTSDKIYPAVGLLIGSIAGVFLAKGVQSLMAKRAEKKMSAKVPQIHAADGAIPAAHEVAAH